MKHSKLITPGRKLLKATEDSEPVDATGSLLYLSGWTRPDIAFPLLPDFVRVHPMNTGLLLLSEFSLTTTALYFQQVKIVHCLAILTLIGPGIPTTEGPPQWRIQKIGKGGSRF